MKGFFNSPWWRALKLLWNAAWSVLVALTVIMELMTGWRPLYKEAHDDGTLGVIATAWALLVVLFTKHALELLTLVVCVAILAHLLVERSRERSRAAYEAARKARPVKRKRRKK